MYASAVCMCLLQRPEKGAEWAPSPWNWGYRCLWTTMCWERNPGPSARPLSTQISLQALITEFLKKKNKGKC